MSGVSSEYKDLAKFAEDTDPHLIVEELEEFLESLKEDFQELNPKTNYRHTSAERKLHKIQKNDRSTKIPMAGHKGTPQYNSPSTWAELKKQSSRRSQCKSRHNHGRN